MSNMPKVTCKFFWLVWRHISVPWRFLVPNSHDKEEYVIQRRNFTQALNNKLVLKNVYRVIKFNQTVWLKSNIDVNT